jgi:hypothetical protein
MSARAAELATALGRWAACEGQADPQTLGWAIDTADGLVCELMRLEERAGSQQLWSLPGHPFARTGGCCLHTRDCFYVMPELAWHQPLTPSQAEAFLRERHEHRRCTECVPDIPEQPWVRVVTPGGQVRWRLVGTGEPP